MEPVTPTSTATLSREPIVGAFEFDPETDTWAWSPEVYAIHGLEACSVTLRRAVVLAHADIEDRESLVRALHSAAWDRVPAMVSYSLLDADARRHKVVLTAEPDDAGPYSVRGRVIDVTGVVEGLAEVRVPAAWGSRL